MKSKPVVLTIAGSDSGGSAGIQADLRVFNEFGLWGVSVITAITAQNPSGISHIETVSVENISEQLKKIFSFYDVSCIKTGMLPNSEIVQCVLSEIENDSEVPLVIDPVRVSTTGVALGDKSIGSSNAYERFLYRSTLITPNFSELETIYGAVIEEEQRVFVAKQIAKKYNTSVVVTGGHGEGNSVSDILVSSAGDCMAYTHPKVDGVNTHGSGCMFAAAVASNIALGESVTKSVEYASDYISRCLHSPACINQNLFLHSSN